MIREHLAEKKGPRDEVGQARRIADGLDLLETMPTDAVLLDLGLPDSEGIETLFTKHAQASGIPVGVLGGQEDEELAVKAVQEGARDDLLKGKVDGDVLKRSIRYTIERRRLAEALEDAKEYRRSAPDTLGRSRPHRRNRIP